MLPRVKAPARKSLPAIWTKQDVEKLLSCIDRDNPVGKRDYASYIIAAELGLLVYDINNLRLDNLKWDSNTIEITQCKTGKLNVLPMTPPIGWALIDYLKLNTPSFLAHLTLFSLFASSLFVRLLSVFFMDFIFAAY